MDAGCDEQRFWQNEKKRKRKGKTINTDTRKLKKTFSKVCSFFGKSLRSQRIKHFFSVNSSNSLWNKHPMWRAFARHDFLIWLCKTRSEMMFFCAGKAKPLQVKWEEILDYAHFKLAKLDQKWWFSLCAGKSVRPSGWRRRTSLTRTASWWRGSTPARF